MSLLDIGQKCHACATVDFLPTTCPGCAHVFCGVHVHAHACGATSGASASGSASGIGSGSASGSGIEAEGEGGMARKRMRGTCGRAGCGAETIESIGGLERGEESEPRGGAGSRAGGGGGAGGEAAAEIAREVRCNGCGGAFCIAHRTQASHDCPAPHEDTARHDATLARRARAQEILARTMPSAAGRERLVMPKQVERVRVREKEEERLPPSVLAEMEEARRRGAEAAATMEGTAPGVGTPTAPPGPATPTSTTTNNTTTTTTDSATSAKSTPPPAELKIHKVHVMKIRSLARPLDPRAPRDQSVAVESVVAEPANVRAWLDGGKYAPSTAAVEIGGKGKAERVWVPLAMPGGKLFDMLVSKAKVRRDDLVLLRIPLAPGSRRTEPIDLHRSVEGQMESGDLLVLVKGWE